MLTDEFGWMKLEDNRSWNTGCEAGLVGRLHKRASGRCMHNHTTMRAVSLVSVRIR